MLTVSLLVCAMMALAAANDEATVIPTAPACREGWETFNGRCFQFIQSSMAWATAETRCLSIGANLASLHSVEENDFVELMIIKDDPKNPAAWIGASNCQQATDHFWSNGKDVTFTYGCWGVNPLPLPEIYPLPPPADLKGCVVMNFGTTTCWATLDCTAYQPFVCAYDL